MTDGGHLRIIEGIAGAGKSYLLGAAREVWEREGRMVVGAALAGQAAEGLEAGADIGSRTLASWERAWSRGEGLLGRGDVFVVDEAGMVGTRQMSRVLGHLREMGARAVLVGDSGQLSAIEAGGPLRALGARHGAARLHAARRQRQGWQRDATRAFFEGDAEAALGAYRDAGRMRRHGSREAARSAVVEAWDVARQRGSVLVLAYRNEDVRALNEAARERRISAGEIERGVRVQVETRAGVEGREFSRGDRVYFRRNDRSMGVTNGTLGTVKSISGRGQSAVLTVQRDGGDEITFSMRDYAAIDLGYAATVHRAQGVTVDRAIVLGDKLMGAEAAYVALSRHREDVELHYDSAAARSDAQLIERMSRSQGQGMISEVVEASLSELQQATEERGLADILEPERPGAEVDQVPAQQQVKGSAKGGAKSSSPQAPIQSARGEGAERPVALDKAEHRGWAQHAQAMPMADARGWAAAVRAWVDVQRDPVWRAQGERWQEMTEKLDEAKKQTGYRVAEVAMARGEVQQAERRGVRARLSGELKRASGQLEAAEGRLTEWRTYQGEVQKAAAAAEPTNVEREREAAAREALDTSAARVTARRRSPEAEAILGQLESCSMPAARVRAQHARAAGAVRDSIERGRGRGSRGSGRGR